ncbi:IS110 family transposase [Lactobacillus delbrueckii]|jgi:transposase|uniref:IS110 family transposase n=1 Tax=Lactobacillus delbrueckii TaxID=1584 RepID=UPI001F5078D3|nr:IS110 family transposase [Lactobacillus delbrueckii]
MNKLFIDIDVSSKDLQVAITNSENYQTPLINEFFSIDLVGTGEVKDIILNLAHYDKVIIGMETTSIYSLHPDYFFSNDNELKELDVETDVINPRQTKRFHDVFEENKNDPVDSYFIAEYLRYRKYRVTIAQQYEYLALQRLTRARYEFNQLMVRTKQHFIETLYYRVNKLVTVDKDKINTSIFGATMMSIITDSRRLDEITQMFVEKLVESFL